MIEWQIGRGVEPLAMTRLIVPERDDQKLLLEAAKVTPDEAQQFTHRVRRIAAILALGGRWTGTTGQACDSFRRSSQSARLPFFRKAATVKPMDWSQCPAVERSATKVSGAWCFRGTRVPVRALFENLEDGASIDQFLDWFPGVARSQVESVLEFAAASLESSVAG